MLPPLTLVEVDYWLRKRGGGSAAFSVLVADIAAGAYQVPILTEEDLARAAELEKAYDDLDLGVVDASVIAVCERIGCETVLTFDRRDFAVVRPAHCRALTLLPAVP